ncbi:MAG: hypothetical protein AAB421_02800 [Patescibacteria group bacterium]
MDEQNTGGMPQVPSGIPQTAPIEAHKSSLGPIVGAVVIIALMVFGGLYYWGSQLQQEAAAELPFIMDDGSVPPASTEDTTAGIPAPSNSDAVVDIEADINNTDFDALDAQIDADLKEVQ